MGRTRVLPRVALAAAGLPPRRASKKGGTGRRGSVTALRVIGARSLHARALLSRWRNRFLHCHDRRSIINLHAELPYATAVDR